MGLRIANAGPGPDSNGIFVDQSRDIVLEGNRTENTMASGIGIWGSSHVVVRRNEIVRACAGGSQESLTIAGTDTFEVENNTVRNAGPDKEGIDAKDGSTLGAIRGNRVSNIPAVGIYVDAWDKATSDIEVSGNTVQRSGNGIALASEMGGLLSNVRIVNNVVTDSTWVGIVITRNGDDPAVLHHPIAGITSAGMRTIRRSSSRGSSRLGACAVAYHASGSSCATAAPPSPSGGAPSKVPRGAKEGRAAGTMSMPLMAPSAVRARSPAVEGPRVW